MGVVEGRNPSREAEILHQRARRTAEPLAQGQRVGDAARRDLHHVQLAGVPVAIGILELLVDAEVDPLQMSRAAVAEGLVRPVVDLRPLQGQADARPPRLHHPVGARAHRLGPEPLRVALGELARDRRGGAVTEDGRDLVEGLGQPDPQALGREGGNPAQDVAATFPYVLEAFDHGQVVGQLRAGFRPDQTAERVHVVLGVHRPAVVEPNCRPELERDLPAVVRDFPPLCRGRMRRPGGGVEVHQRVREEAEDQGAVVLEPVTGVDRRGLADKDARGGWTLRHSSSGSGRRGGY